MNRIAFLTLCIAALMSLTACGGDETPTREATDTERQALAEAVAMTAVHDDGGEVGSIADSIALLDGHGMPALSLTAEGELIGRRGAFELNFEVDCHNRFGMEIPCSLNATSAEVRASWSASLSFPRRTMTASYDGEWTIERAPAGRYRIDGRGDLLLESDFASASEQNTKTTDFRWSANYEGLIVDPDAQRRPIDGQVVYAVEIEKRHDTPGRDRTERIAIDARLVFDGADADLWVDEDRFRVDVRHDGEVRVFDAD